MIRVFYCLIVAGRLAGMPRWLTWLQRTRAKPRRQERGKLPAPGPQRRDRLHFCWHACIRNLRERKHECVTIPIRDKVSIYCTKS
jgi:hypothetical protein